MFNRFKKNKDCFQNKVGIITGSSRGIGKATAIELCEKGATVVLNGRDLVKLNETKLELQKKGYNVMAIQADITSSLDCEKMMNQVIESYGKLDFLINNGSLTMNENITTLEPEYFQKIFMSNGMGSILPTLAAIPHLRKQKGSVIFISSLAGLHGMPAASAYSAGKMALTAFWQSLKIELCQTGIHFGICYLGFTENDTEKRMLSAGGQLVPVPKRPKFIQKTQGQVARIIANTLQYRRAKVVVSSLGKCVNFIMRYFPNMTLLMMMKSQKRKRIETNT